MKRERGKDKRNTPLLLSGLVALLVVFFLANVGLGSVLIPLGDLISILLGQATEENVLAQIVLDFRLPQAITAVLGGAALAVSGLLMQTVFRNPLADPFVLGVNSGASLGVAIVLLVLAPSGVALTQSLGISGQLLVVVAASLGSAVVLLIVLSFASRMDVMSLLILGLMISYSVGAMVSIMMFFTMAERLQSFFTWSFGQFGNVTWEQLPIFAPIILLSAVSIFFIQKPLDALLLGEHYAESLGTRVKAIRYLSMTIASVLAGTVTGFCGPIGFLGIAAPHLCRFIFKTSQHNILIPASLLMGGTMALAADLIAKAPGFDTVLPLNAITALFGAPVIILALIKQRNLRNLFGK